MQWADSAMVSTTLREVCDSFAKVELVHGLGGKLKMSGQYLLWYLLVSVLLGQHPCQHCKVIKHMKKLMLHKISRAGVDPVFYYPDIHSQQRLDMWIFIAKKKHS